MRSRPSIEPRETSIRVRFTVGKVRYKKTLTGDGAPLAPTVANLKYASKVATAIGKALDLGVFEMGDYFPDDASVVSANVTLGQHLDNWIATLRLESSTITGYRSVLNFWKTAQYSVEDSAAKLGDRALKDITLTDLRTVVALREELSGKTINNCVSVLHEAMNLAVADKIITRNVAAEMAKAKWQKPPVDPFSRDEVEAILGYFSAHYAEPVYNMLEFWFFTGLRSSELVGLRWSNVDFASGYVLVSEAIVRGVHKDNTKTNVARRVMLNSRSLAALQRQRKHTMIADGLVWLNPDKVDEQGKPIQWVIEHAFLDQYWKRAVRAVGVRYRRPYTCRHSYATMMLMSDMNDAFCAKQLGHSIDVFRTTYAKWIDGDQNDAEMGKFEAAMRSDQQRKEAV